MLQTHSALRPFFRRYLGVTAFTAVAGMSLATAGGALAAPCTGPGAPTTTETKCLTAVAIPGNPLRSFDISWVNPFLNQYYFADRSNAGIEVINTVSNMFTVRLGGFVGIKLNPNGTVNNNISGPDGVTSHGNWVYGGDGNSTLKVFNVFTPPTTQPLARHRVPRVAKREGQRVAGGGAGKSGHGRADTGPHPRRLPRTCVVVLQPVRDLTDVVLPRCGLHHTDAQHRP